MGCPEAAYDIRNVLLSCVKKHIVRVDAADVDAASEGATTELVQGTKFGAGQDELGRDMPDQAASAVGAPMLVREVHSHAPIHIERDLRREEPLSFGGTKVIAPDPERERERERVETTRSGSRARLLLILPRPTNVAPRERRGRRMSCVV